MRVAVIGAGSWGTAVSWLLSGNGHEVSLWSRESEIAQGINAEHHNPICLPDVELGASVHASADFEEVLSGAEAAVMVTPSIGARETALAMKPHLAPGTPVVILSKGVEGGSNMLMTEVLTDVLGNRSRIAGLSGPNHAEEVSKGIPSATVVAAYEPKVGELFQNLFMAPFFRVYTNPDVVGVELCGASKNVIAIAAGMCDGLGYGDNTKATLMTRGLAEMTRLGKRLGANPMTYMGLAGMGDLIVTCTSRHSRNRGFGESLAKGGSLAEYTERTHMVVEGAVACVTVDELATREGLELPITRQVRAILYEGQPVESAEQALLGRGAKDELHGLGLVDD
jgi:glycerol-3-phosphate dehydrogenase (NAD(P)+)